MSEAAKPPDRRILAVALALGAAAALAYACVVKTWLYNPRNKSAMEVGFGLVQNFMCTEPGDASTCRTLSNSEVIEHMRKELDDIKKRAAADTSGDPTLAMFVAKASDELRTSRAFAPFGLVTLVCCALGALSLLVSAGLVLAKKRILWPIMPTTTAILGVGIGLITGCVFVATKPGPSGFVGVNYGFWAFGAGVLLGIGSSLMLNKLLRPADPDLLEDAMDPEQY